MHSKLIVCILKKGLWEINTQNSEIKRLNYIVQTYAWKILGMLNNISGNMDFSA